MHNLTRRQFLAGVAGSTVYATHRSLRAAKYSPENKAFAVGIAKIDITPDYPIRLSGFGGRRTESEGVTHPIWAKAMSIDYGDAAPLLLITVDNLECQTTWCQIWLRGFRRKWGWIERTWL
jgi:hypothetical protein